MSLEDRVKDSMAELSPVIVSLPPFFLLSGSWEAQDLLLQVSPLSLSKDSWIPIISNFICSLLLLRQLCFI